MASRWQCAGNSREVTRALARPILPQHYSRHLLHLSRPSAEGLEGSGHGVAQMAPCCQHSTLPTLKCQKGTLPLQTTAQLCNF